MNSKQQKEQKEMFAAFLAKGHMYYINEVIKRPASQAEFATWLGISPQTLTRLINGQSMPTLDNLIPIANRLGPKAYEIAEIPRLMPDNRLAKYLAENVHRLNEKQQEALYDYLQTVIENQEVEKGATPIAQMSAA